MKNTFIRIIVETVYMKNKCIRIIIETLYMKNTPNTSLLLMFLCFLFCIYHSAYTTVQSYYYIFDDFFKYSLNLRIFINSTKLIPYRVLWSSTLFIFNRWIYKEFINA